MSATHTPGPWHVTAVGMRGNVQAIVGIAGSDGYGYPVAHCMQRRTGDADARLIAAAPDLLAALRNLLPHVDSEVEQRKHGLTAEDWDELEALSDAAYAALAKAGA